MEKIFYFCGNAVYLKERKQKSSVLSYNFDDKYIEFEISDTGAVTSIASNMNKAQVYYNLNSIKELYSAYRHASLE